MNEFDRATISTADGPLQTQNQNSIDQQVENKLYAFLREYMEDHVFVYREQLRSNLLVPEYSLSVDMRHLQSVDAELAHEITQKPEYLVLFENAARRLAKQIHFQEDQSLDTVPDIQILLKSAANPLPMRQITSDHISKLVRLSGIVSSAAAPSAKATRLHLYCRVCRHVKIIPVNKGFSGVQIPRSCENADPSGDRKDCGLDPYLVSSEKSMYVDQQVLKLQESPDMVPVGELPRHMLLTVDRYLTNKVVPGARVTVVGVYDIFQRQSTKSDATAAAVRQPYVRVVGMDIDLEVATRGKRTFTPEEEARYIELSRRPDIYQLFSRSIAPSIYGNEDIKKSIACLLVGGSKKLLPDGMRLRGDINVLLLGDPGTAKSQLLKFVEKVSPIAVYTSGKGSSAAGLTASIIRDPATREFYLEGGAMVLADGGVVCIDEFDKMREEDRVAIHEAMEQQTISIAKAGITTILNSRTSVLAAANPIFGRYDDMKTPGENIDFQTTILSRFDMIYILRDEHNQARDEALAKHVMSVHARGIPSDSVEGEMDIATMRGFLTYCKAKCAPRLSIEASEKLASHFVEIRSQVSKYETEANSRSSVPITIRQLEAIIRISESLAKMSLSPIATEQHVDEAIRLFRVSTYAATQSGYLTGEGMMVGQVQKELRKAEDDLRRRLPLGQKIAERALIDFLVKRGFSDYVAQRTLYTLQLQGKVQYTHQGKFVVRTAV